MIIGGTQNGSFSRSVALRLVDELLRGCNLHKLIIGVLGLLQHRILLLLVGLRLRLRLSLGLGERLLLILL